MRRAEINHNKILLSYLLPRREGSRGGEDGKISYVAHVKAQLIWRASSSVLIMLSLSVQLSSYQ